MNDKNIKWAAKLSGVRELTIQGTANLDYWSQQLAQTGLRPQELNGNAQILIISAAARFMGLHFSEMSISVVTANPQPNSNDESVYLVHAFNSRRFFAFCERALFHTPYQFGSVDVTTTSAPSLVLTVAGKYLFHAAMNGKNSHAPIREPINSKPDGWEGIVHLPSARAGKRKPRHFFARLGGHTNVYAFDTNDDTCMIERDEHFPVFAALIESQFSPTQWIVRAAASHAKSKTYTSDILNAD
jgi:hypothetical protein